METDFDKEIDAILRRAHRSGPVLVGDLAGARHLDADEISAFAENMMPENARALYSAHLAECDRCRKILSNLLVMNAEAAPEAANHSAIAIAQSAEPWYRRLFLFPNLAYVMGGLVLVFGGFLAFTVVQNSRVVDSGVVSQATDSGSTGGGPYFESEPSYESNSNTNSAANMSANVAARSTMSISNANAGFANSAVGNSASISRAGRENNFLADRSTTDNVMTGSAPPASSTVAPPPPVAAAPREREADILRSKVEDKAAGLTIQEQQKKDTMLKQSPGSLSATQSGPMQSSQSVYNRQLENLDRRAARKMSGRRDEDATGTKVVAGKTFEKKQGVWYDTTYQGRPTTNVRRGTAEFNRLDSGLRSIANSLSGTVVIVWGTKAYRIQ